MSWLRLWVTSLTLMLLGCSRPYVAEQVTQWGQSADLAHLAAAVKSSEAQDAVRAQAAVALLQASPIKGRYRGIDALVATLRSIDAAERSRVLIPVVTAIAAKLSEADGDNVAYKDAGYMLLIDDHVVKGPLLAAGEAASTLRKALTNWAVTDFSARSLDSNQRYGMSLLFQVLGPNAVGKLVPLLKTEKRKRAIVHIIAKQGAPQVLEQASGAIVALIKEAAAAAWRAGQKKVLMEANSRAGFSPTPRQLEAQLRQYQDEHLVRLFSFAKKIGGAAVVSHCLELGADEAQSSKRRQVALAALAGNIAPNNAEATTKLLALAAKDGTPPIVLDHVLRRIKELPRGKVAAGLYEIFKKRDWKYRRAAASTLLELSSTEHIAEFLGKLDDNATKNFSLPEAITYGARLGELTGGNPRAILTAHMKTGRAPSRLSALAYWYTHGAKADVARVLPYGDDSQSIPQCEDEAGCHWQCMVARGENKTVQTVGQFVRYCVVPKLERSK